MTVMLMLSVATLLEVSHVPVTLDIQEMDSLVQVCGLCQNNIIFHHL